MTSRFHCLPLRFHAILNRQARRSLDNLLIETRNLATLPKCGSVHDAIDKWPAVRPSGAFQGPFNTDKFTLEVLIGCPNHRITVSGKIEKGKVRGEIRIGSAASLRCVSRTREFQAGVYAVMHQ